MVGYPAPDAGDRDGQRVFQRRPGCHLGLAGKHVFHHETLKDRRRSLTQTVLYGIGTFAPVLVVKIFSRRFSFARL